MSEYDPNMEEGPDEELRAEYYRQHPELGKAYDYLIASGQDDTNWRRIMHEISPKTSGKALLEVAEAQKNAKERATFRKYIMIYRAEISLAVQKAIDQGKLPASDGPAKLEEIFERPLIPEGEEIVI